MPVSTITHKLCRPNARWDAPARLPSVTVVCRRTQDCVSFMFDVADPERCFRCTCKEDGDPCWQDSCVEIFIARPRSRMYVNIETNALGVSLGQWGEARNGREPFTRAQYHQLRRTVLISPQPTPPGDVRWAVQIDIPTSFLGMTPFDAVIGNLYKCAACAETPHYLSRFTVDAPAPDFHRPECFRNLFL